MHPLTPRSAIAPPIRATSCLPCRGWRGLVILAAAFPFVASAFQQPAGRESFINLDRRPQPNPPPQVTAQSAAFIVSFLAASSNAEIRLRARIPELEVARHEIIHSPKWISARRGFLTEPGGGGRAMEGAGAAAHLQAASTTDPHRIVKAFVNEHAALFGHDATLLERARVTRDYVAANNGLRTTVWQQEHEGISVFEAVFLAHVTRSNELVNVGSQFVPAQTLSNAMNAPLTPSVSPAQALRLAAAHLGDEAAESAGITALDEPAGAERTQRFLSGVAKGEARAKLVWLPLDAATLRLCWQLNFTSRARNEMFRILVDATTGEVWIRQGLTDYISNASYRVFTGDSPTPLSPAHSGGGDFSQPSEVPRTLVTTPALDTTASPSGWINDGVNETRGNNVDAHADLDDDENPDLPRPQGSPNRVFDFPANLTQSPSSYRNAAIVNLFYWNNWIHDRLYQLGFTEAAGNFQVNNFGKGGLGNDAVTADAQDGGGTKNANFGTPEDGEVPRMQMYLWPDANPDRDGDFDAQIIIHEYVHGLSNRRVGGGALITAYITKGMGEGWSDFYAHALLSSPGDPLNGNYPLGAYVLLTYKYDANTPTFLDNYYFGIRRYPLSTELSVDPLTFKDIDAQQADPHPSVPVSERLPFSGTGVHDLGEVWCAALWDMRANLIAKHGYATGNQLALELVSDGMGLCPVNPNFLQARDAILQADQVNNGGANLPQLWSAFAKRGMGFFATAPGSSTAAGVVESFDVLDKLRVTPSAGSQAAGPVGGPFVFTNFSFVLSNTGPGSLTWRATAEPPLELSVLSGTLPANASVTRAVAFNATAAATLATGIHTRSIVFSNEASGATLKRDFHFFVGQPVERAEELAAGAEASALASKQFTFTPDGSDAFYSVFRAGIVSFPTPTAGATTLSLTDDNFQQVNLSAGKTFSYYGIPYSSFYVGANGFITFGEGDTSWDGKLDSHFELPRISGVFADLSQTANSRVSWQQFADRAVVSWENLRQFQQTRTNSFQVELFFDGRIRISYAKQEGTPSVAGLSRGGGIPVGFQETHFAITTTCLAGPLSLSLPTTVTEGNGTVTGLVSIVGMQPANVTVNLASSDTTELTFPATTVIIPSGSTSAVFSVTVVNEAVADGSQIAYLTASAGGFDSATAVVWVNDNESAALTMSAISPATENGTQGQGMISLGSTAADTICVTLSSSNPDELAPTLPLIFIPQGQTSAVFTVQAVDDSRIDGSQPVTVTATVTNWTSASQPAIAVDNENANLTLKSTFFLNESMGTITNGGTAGLSGTLPTNLLVAVLSDDESEVRTPLFGVFIPAGQTNVSFPLFVQDDAVIDGLVITRLRALASGFGSATNFVWVGDNDGPPEPYDPSPADDALHVSVDADLSWGRVENELVVNGDFESGDFTGWTQTGNSAGGWGVNDGTFNPESPDGPLPPFAGSFSALAQQLGNGTHALYQDIAIPIGPTSVTLSWMDRIRNHAGSFNSSQQFRVELRDADSDDLLSTLFTTTASTPLLGDWTNRTFNLNDWRGRTVRLKFIEQDALGHLNVHLDHVSLIASPPIQTFFEVFLGTNNPPTAGDFLGSTSNPSWTLPLLAGGMDYYWQVRSRRLTTTNAGPIWHFRTEGASSNVTYFGFKSSWRYRGGGVNLGTAWTNLNYSEAGWGTGNGLLGFGSGEDTTIGNAANGYVTYYFRKGFNVADAQRVASLTARLQRDDGAIVWINGRLAMASNVPRPPIAYDEQASSANEGLFQLLPVVENLDPKLLVDGTNIVAVEVHQFHPRDSLSPDLYFDLELKAWVNTGNEAPRVSLTTPSDFALVRLPTNVVLQASFTDEFVLLPIGFTMEFFAGGVKLGEDTSLPYSFTWTNPPAGQHALTAVVTDTGGLKGTSTSVQLVVAPATGQVVSLIVPGTTWRYLDTGLDPGAGWMLPSYREPRGSGWKGGIGELGYGDGDESTVVSYGPDPFDKHITTWFRHTFTVPANLTGVTLRVLRDDGARVFINGTEFLRNNLPAGAITLNTLASATVAGSSETVWIATNLPTNLVLPLLSASGNVVAAEVHQSSAATPDLSFDLELLGAGNALPNVALISPANNSFVPPAPLLLSATANDPYGQIAQVAFYDGAVLLGTDAAAPFDFQWSNPAAGAHQLSAIATDNQGATNKSAVITLNVLAPVSLQIALHGTQADLLWPTNAPGYSLEFATNLVPPLVWEPLLLPAGQTNGQFIVTVDLVTERYFRLRAP